MDNIIHCFEAAGLGVAPFTFETATWGDWDNCMFCQHEIKQKCWIKDANGKQFYVGNECVNKTGDVGLINETKEAVKILKREMKREREEKRILDGKLLLGYSEKLRNELANTPFNPERPQTGSVFSWVEKNYNAYWATKKGKLAASDTVFEAADRYLTQDEINNFWDSRKEIIAQIAIQKEKEEKERAEKAEQERIRNAEIRAKIQEDNKELINVLSSSYPSPFITDMIWKLKATALPDFSIRQVEVLSDIYGKSFGRRGSKEYQEAYSKIYNQGKR
jgi:hypothetical protein